MAGFVERRLLHCLLKPFLFQLVDEEVHALRAVNVLLEDVCFDLHCAPIARPVGAAVMRALRRRCNHYLGELLQFL